LTPHFYYAYNSSNIKTNWREVKIMKRKKDFEKAKANAEKIHELSLNLNKPFLEIAKDIETKLGVGNFFARVAAGSIRSIGWYSANVNGVKTLLINN
jgi:hypothetical protein